MDRNTMLGAMTGRLQRQATSGKQQA